MGQAVGMTVAEYLVGQLRAWGVKHVFGVSGDSIFGLMDALRKNPDLTFCLCRHEETAALMASAYAKLTGEMAVCLADGGPGSLHLVNGLMDALQDHVPVLALTGQVERQWIGTTHIQAMDFSRLFGGVTGYTATIVTPEQAPRLLEAAVKTAYTLGAPVHLALAKDVQALPAAAAVDPRGLTLGSTPKLDEEAVGRAADLLVSAARPVILAGRATRGRGEDVLALARALGAAVVTSLAAKGAVPETDGLVTGCLGLAGNAASRRIMKQADAVLILGSTWWPEGFVPQKARVVEVDLRPERIGAGAPVEVAIVGDVAEVLPLLVARVRQGKDGRNGKNGRKGKNGAWAGAVTEEIRRRDAWTDGVARGGKVPVHPAVIMRALEEAAAPDAVLTLDTGDHTLWFGAHFRARNQDVLLSGMWRTMGFGLPAAMAAKLARPDRQVICLTGDGGLGMILADLATAVKYRLPVTVVVANNGSYALEAHKQVKDGYPVFGQDFLNPDFAGLMNSLGGRGRRLERAEDLQGWLREAASSDVPWLIDVPTQAVPPPEHGPLPPH